MREGLLPWLDKAGRTFVSAEKQNHKLDDDSSIPDVVREDERIVGQSLL